MTHIQTTYTNHLSLRGGKKKKKGTRPTEVRALTPVFEKSATEFKQKQKLHKCKSPIQIVTFNVRTFDRIPELTASAMDHNIDIVCVQEHRYLHSEGIKYHDTSNG